MISPTLALSSLGLIPGSLHPCIGKAPQKINGWIEVQVHTDRTVQHIKKRSLAPLFLQGAKTTIHKVFFSPETLDVVEEVVGGRIC